MRNIPRLIDTETVSAEEVAERLSLIEGRVVSVVEVRKIEAIAMRKLRREILKRGLSMDWLLPDI